MKSWRISAVGQEGRAGDAESRKWDDCVNDVRRRCRRRIE